MSQEVGFWSSLFAGGLAGSTVDCIMYPLDTVKTRVQSAHGFKAAGGFKNVFKGIPAAAAGSFPTSALFFVTYERSKKMLFKVFPENSTYAAFVPCGAAAMGEIVACLVRVPTENVKQKMQAGQYASVRATLQGIQSQGLHKFYAGYFSTVMRDIPFSFIQFPMWEFGKRAVSKSTGKAVEPWQGALCGAIAGGFSGACTTPFDVVKTRMMLGADANGVPYTTMRNTIGRLYTEGGISVLYSGVVPRTGWLTIGGLVFCGAYEYGKSFCVGIFNDSITIAL